jgi:hypothetical protein
MCDVVKYIIRSVKFQNDFARFSMALRLLLLDNLKKVYLELKISKKFYLTK